MLFGFTLYSFIDFKFSGKLLKSLLSVYPNDIWPCTVLNAGIFTLTEVITISYQMVPRGSLVI